MTLPGRGTSLFSRARATPGLAYPVELAFRPALASLFKNLGASAPEYRGRRCRRVETRLPSEGAPGRRRKSRSGVLAGRVDSQYLVGSASWPGHSTSSHSWG